MGDEEAKKLEEDTIGTLRRLSHDLSNAIENVTQACYLLSQSRLDAQNAKWLALINSSAEDAARLNREIRNILRSNS